MINVEVSRNNNESTASVIRRFTKRVQGAGVLPRVRSLRYRSRTESRYTRKQGALTKLSRRAAYNKLEKLGKLPEKPAKGKGGPRR